MAVTAAEMQILLRARDEASGVVQKFRGELGSIAKSLPREALQGLKSDLGNAGKAMPTAEARRLAGELDNVDRSAGQARGGIRGLIDGLGKLGFAVFGVQQLVGAVKGMVGPFISLASDLNETVNKVGVVFGESAGQVMKFGDTSARALGMSKNTALAAAGTFGNLFTTIGLGKKTSADFSTQLLQNAADLASFNNIDPTVVLDKLRSGLVGETEPLRALGIDVSDAAMKVEAATQGIGKNTEAMTQGEKVALRYAIIQKQMGNAAGDFARTSGDLANSQRILAASWQDLQTQVGALFLPAMNAIVNALKDAVGGVQTWLEENKVAIQAWGEIIGEGVNTAVGAVRGLASAFGQAFGAVLEIVSSVGQAIWDALQWINPFASHSPSLVSQVDAGVDEVIGSYRRMAGIEEPIGRAADAIEDFKAMGKDALAGVIEGSEAAIDATRERVEAMKEVIGLTKEELSGLKDELRGAKDALRGLSDVPIAGMGEFDAQLDAIKTKSNEVKLQLTQMKLSGAPKEQVEGLEAELRRLGLEADRVELEKRLKFDPLQKQIKAIVKPPGGEMAFEDIIKQAQSLTGQIGELEPAIADADKRLAEQTALLKPLESAMAAQEKVLKAQREAYQDMAKEVKAAGAAVKGAFGAGTEPNKALDAFKDAGKTVDEFKESVKRIKSDVERALSPLSRAFGNLTGRVTDLWRSVSQSSRFQAITHLFRGWAQAIGGVAGALAKGDIGGAIEKLGKAVTTWLIPLEKNYLGALGDISGSIFTWLKEQWGNIDFAAVWKSISDIGAALVTAGLDIGTGLLTWLGEQWGNLKDKWPEIWKLAGDIGGGLWSIALNIGDWVKEQWGKVSDKWPEIWETAGDIAGGIWKVVLDVTGWLGEQWSKIKWVEVWANVSNIFATGLTYARKAADWLGETWAAIPWADIWAAAGNIFQGAVEIAGTVTTWLKEQWGKINWGIIWNAAKDALGDLLGVGIDIVEALEKWLAVQFSKVDPKKVYAGLKGPDGLTVPADVERDSKSDLQRFFDAIGGIFESARKAIEQAGKLVGGALAGALGLILTAAKEGVKGIRSWLTAEDGGKGIEIDFKAIFLFIKGAGPISLVVEAFKTFFKGVGQGIIDNKHLVLDPLRELAEELAALMADIARKATGMSTPAATAPSKLAPGTTYEDRERERRLYGFQHGGSFRVGGAGGADSQVVAFKATPGERVTITPAAMGGVSNSDNRTVNITNNIVAPNGASVADRFLSDPRIMRHLRPRPVW